MSSPVVHFEIHASEPQRLIDYYGALLGWRFEQYGDVPYWTIAPGEGSIGGGLTQREGPAPAEGAPISGGVFVVGVDDADASMARGVELGGTEAVAIAEMPDIGRLGYLRDPDGNVFGVISQRLADGSRAGPDRASDPMQVTPEP